MLRYDLVKAPSISIKFMISGVLLSTHWFFESNIPDCCPLKQWDSPQCIYLCLLFIFNWKVNVNPNKMLWLHEQYTCILETSTGPQVFTTSGKLGVCVIHGLATFQSQSVNYIENICDGDWWWTSTNSYL